jgi:O-antigen ligase
VKAKWILFERFLVFLLVFLLPTQLAYHFWPPSSFVFGIRVDYLAPAIYLTDLLILSLLGLWLIRRQPKILPIFKKYGKILLLVAVFILINISFSLAPVTSIFRWIKILEAIGLSIYLRAEIRVIGEDFIYKAIFYSLLFFSLIGISQFLLGRTIGGAFYFLGERSFSSQTPGIALTQINGREYLRAYSVFPHPNSLAGYFGASFLFLLTVNYFKKTPVHILGFLIIILCLVLTFSVSAFTSLTLALFLLLLYQKKKISLNFVKAIFLTAVLFSLMLPVVGMSSTPYLKNLGSTITERLNLSVASGKVIEQKFLLGEGLGNFVTGIPEKHIFTSGQWLLQPVHNIFLLAFSETGFFGFLLLCFIFYHAVETKFFSVFLFIVITGVFDHYWLTLQQNILLLTLIFGMVSRAWPFQNGMVKYLSESKKNRNSF